MDLKIYACGGTGINIGKIFEKFRGKEETGFSTLDICYIDSSNSNIRNIQTDEKNVYVIEDSNGEQKEGGGKKRVLNYEDISARVPELLLKFKPAKINLVVHSFSGGSGSVIGPVLVSHLLDKGNLTIVLGVGGSDSGIEMSNTMDTIKSYTAISKLRKKSVPCVYYENSHESPRGTVDKKLNLDIVMISAYFSGQNHELDFQDLYNFLNYTEVTDWQPKLSYLEFFTGDIELGKDHNVISVATLSDDETPTNPNISVEYQCTGFINNEVKSKLGTKMPIHWAVIDGVFNNVMHSLTTKLKALHEQKKARLNKEIEVDTETTGEGLVI